MEQKPLFTKRESNELAQIARDKGLRLLDFTTDFVGSGFSIKHKTSHYSFRIEKLSPAIYEYLKVGPDGIGHRTQNSVWVGVTNAFSNWAKIVHEDINTPTGWESAANSNLFRETFEDLSQPFSALESEEIRQGLNMFKESYRLLNLQAEKLEIMDAKLDQTFEQAANSNKFDFWSLLIGTTMGLLQVLAIPQEAQGLIWHYFNAAFNVKRLTQ